MTNEAQAKGQIKGRQEMVIKWSLMSRWLSGLMHGYGTTCHRFEPPPW